MSKRFTDTDKYKKPFLRGLPGAYKLLWDYICNDCNHAGIWIVDFEVAGIYLGRDLPINQKEALALFNQDKARIAVLDGGKRWFILSFIQFQYGELNPQNRAHLSVISQLKSYNLWDEDKKEIKPLISPLQGDSKDVRIKDKDKDKEIKGGPGENIPEEAPVSKDQIFDEFRKAYPGVKRGNETEFQNFQKKHTDWKDVLPVLIGKLNKQKAWRREAKAAGMFVPEWKNLQTWINQRCWEDELQTIIQKDHGNTENQSNLSTGQKKYITKSTL